MYERVSDYLHNMSALTRGEARRQWRQSIKDAWNNRCAYCGKPPIDDDSLTVDHVRPKSSGGEDKTSNCIPACRECNQDKSSQEWAAWYRMQPFYSIAAEWRIQQWLRVASRASDLTLRRIVRLLMTTSTQSAVTGWLAKEGNPLFTDKLCMDAGDGQGYRFP